MKLNQHFNKTPFYLAVEKEDVDIIKIFLANDNLDPNIPYIICKKIF